MSLCGYGDVDKGTGDIRGDIWGPCGKQLPNRVNTLEDEQSRGNVYQ